MITREWPELPSCIVLRVASGTCSVCMDDEVQLFGLGAGCGHGYCRCVGPCVDGPLSSGHNVNVLVDCCWLCISDCCATTLREAMASGQFPLRCPDCAANIVTRTPQANAGDQTTRGLVTSSMLRGLVASNIIEVKLLWISTSLITGVKTKLAVLDD